MTNMNATEDPMKENERVEGLTALSRQMMTQYHERRNLEWRIHVLLWTLLVAALTSWER